MNISNNPLRRIMCIFVSLTLCTGLCAGADLKLSKMVLAEGESRDLGDGYSITAIEIDMDADKAIFRLTKLTFRTCLCKKIYFFVNGE